MAGALQVSAELIPTRKAFGDALLVLGEKYKNLVVVDADLSTSTYTLKFGEKFPERHFNVGIAEQDCVDTAAGLAMAGKLPFACSFAIFAAGIGWHAFRNGVCYPNLNVKLVGSHAGIMTGEDGATHQALEDLAIMRVIPNAKVFCPADAVETKKLMEKLVDDFGPAYVRLGRQGVPVIYDASYKFEIGKGSVLLEGDDIGIIATGSLVGSALAAGERFRKEGVSVRVVNISTIKPLDDKLVEETARKVKVLVTAEDHQIEGGLAGAVAESLSQHFPRTFYRIGMNGFGESGKAEDLYKKYGFDADGVYDRVKHWWSEAKT